MPRVSRLSGTATEAEGFAVETESGGSTYRYEFRILEHPDDDESGTPGKVELDVRYEDGTEIPGEATQAAKKPLNERGYEVV